MTDDLRMTLYELAETVASTTTTGLSLVAAGTDGVIGALWAVPNVATHMQPTGCSV